jgi:hypothetical protein
MVEHPGMWDEARALFRVGTVVGVVRKMAETALVRGKHRARRRLGKRLDYRKGANDQTRAKDRSLRQLLQRKRIPVVGAAEGCDLLIFYLAGTKAGTDEVCQINTLLTRFSSVSRISNR